MQTSKFSTYATKAANAIKSCTREMDSFDIFLAASERNKKWIVAHSINWYFIVCSM